MYKYSKVNDPVTAHPAEYESVVVKGVYDLGGGEVFFSVNVKDFLKRYGVIGDECA